MARLIILAAILIGALIFYFLQNHRNDDSFANVRQAQLSSHKVDVRTGRLFALYALNARQQLEIKNLLQNQKFFELEQVFQGYDTEYKKNIEFEGKIVSAFDVIGFKHLEQTVEWVRQYPKSAYARLARGLAYNSAGWNARGTAFSGETPDENFVKMREKFLIAKHDIDDALKINSMLTSAYCALINMAAAKGDKEEQLSAYREGIKHVPFSFSVRYCYLNKIEPKWGGSIQQMEAFVDVASEHLSKNPRIKLLSEYLSFVRGKKFYYDRKYEKSIAEFSSAISQVAMWRTLRYRYFAYEKLGENALALRDNDYALQINPDVYVVLKDRIRLLRKLKRYQEAITVIDDFMKFYDDEADILVQKGNVLWDMQEYKSAYQAFLDALELEPNNKDALYGKAKLGYHQLNQPQQALNDMLQAFEVSGSPFIWYEYASLQWYMKDKSAVKSYRIYLEMCGEKSCKRRNVDWAREFLACVDKTAECRRPSEFDVSWAN